MTGERAAELSRAAATIMEASCRFSLEEWTAWAQFIQSFSDDLDVRALASEWGIADGPTVEAGNAVAEGLLVLRFLIREATGA